MSYSRVVIERNFETHPVPDAYCGNDYEEYSYYYRKSPSKKLIIYLGGGGACWNSKTCFGAIRKAVLRLRGTDCPDILCHQKSPLSLNNQYSIAIFPYCTGDIYVGEHNARYQSKTVRHMGRANLRAGLQELRKRNSLNKVDELLVIGSSAGALGALLNLGLIDSSFPEARKKKLIADSPGLHFPEEIWKHFSPMYQKNLQEAYLRNALNFQEKQTPLAAQMKKYCQKHPSWKIGILQGAKDWIMSLAFGKMHPMAHKRLVLGPKGIQATLQNAWDNCASWTPNSHKHEVLKRRYRWNTKTSNQVNALDFVQQVLSDSQYHPSHF